MSQAQRFTDDTDFPPRVETTITYEISHKDGTKTIRTVVEKSGDDAKTTEEKVPAPRGWKPAPTTPIKAPRGLPAGAGWRAKRNTEINTKGVKTETTTYSVDAKDGSYTQVEVKVGKGDLLVTKTPLVPSA